MLLAYKTHILTGFTPSSSDGMGGTVPASVEKYTIPNDSIGVEGFKATDEITTLDRDTYQAKRTNSYLTSLATQGTLALAPSNFEILDKVGFNLRQEHTPYPGVKSNGIKSGLDLKKYAKPFLLEPTLSGLPYKLYLRCAPKGGINDFSSSKEDYLKVEVPFDIFTIEDAGYTFSVLEADNEQDLVNAIDDLQTRLGMDFFLVDSNPFTPAS